MKKIILSLLSICLFTSLFAKSPDVELNADGVLFIDNSSGIVQDRIRVINKTLSFINFSVFIVNKKTDKTETFYKGNIKAGDTSYLSSDFEDQLKKFKSITFEFSNGTVLDYKVEFAHSDMYVTITDFAEKSSTVDVPEVDPTVLKISNPIKASGDSYNQIRVNNLSSFNDFTGKVIQMKKEKDGSFTKKTTIGGFKLGGFDDTDTISTEIEENTWLALQLPEDILNNIKISGEHKDYPFFDVFLIIIEDK